MNINMEHKNIVATIYLKDGKAIKARDNYEEYPDVIELAKLYNDSGIDKIMIFDLSRTDEEHERNIQAVSYTHLDVYKRQMQKISRSEKK